MVVRGNSIGRVQHFLAFQVISLAKVRVCKSMRVARLVRRLVNFPKWFSEECPHEDSDFVLKGRIQEEGHEVGRDRFINSSA